MAWAILLSLAGTEKVNVAFDLTNQECFFFETVLGKSKFSYDKIVLIAETDEYFVFVFRANHAQIYDKNNLSGGTVDAFGKFISEITDKTIIAVQEGAFL